MKIISYFGHPSQYLFLKHAIRILRDRGHSVLIVIKSKDVLIELLKNDKEEFVNILKEGRGANFFSISIALIKREFRLNKIVRKVKPDLLIGTDPSLSHIGLLNNIQCITCLEDDYQVIKKLAWLTFPFTSNILAPEECDIGRWTKKKISYKGYMKLSYLHPAYFFPVSSKVAKVIHKKYFLIRLPKLTAYHDYGIRGIDKETLDQIIMILSKHGEVYISAERKLDTKFEKYRLVINPSDLHHFLNYAQILISDSQSMSVEAAMLGTPSIRISDFAGRIGVLEELEHKYALTFGIKPESAELLFLKIHELLSIENLNDEFQIRRQSMLNDKIDVTRFLVWLIENYPQSSLILKNNPDYQDVFK